MQSVTPEQILNIAVRFSRIIGTKFKLPKVFNHQMRTDEATDGAGAPGWTCL
jgi:hypothetical protein